MVRDWNDMERIWQYVYSKDQLQTFSEEVCVAAAPTWLTGSGPCTLFPTAFLGVFYIPRCILIGPAAFLLCVC